MTQKFKLTTETKIWLGKTLYRIEALVSFGVVKAGEKGGFVEAEKNVSQDGDAWVYGNAQVYGNARVSGDAQVYGNAQVFGDAWVYGNARVSGDAQVYGNAQVFGDAWVYGNAQVYGNALVSPINIIGMFYHVTITDTQMMIGCELHDIEAWHKFDNRRILEMDGKAAAKFWAENKASLMAMADAHAKKAAAVAK